jgi:hypothetical protein
MSSRKEQNDEEKRGKLLQVFHEGKEFYNIKELEKLAKEKGIAQKQVKELLTRLVDDEAIESNKIGSTLFYWSFPGKKTDKLKVPVEEMKAKNKKLKDELEVLKETLRVKTERKVRDH